MKATQLEQIRNLDGITKQCRQVVRFERNSKFNPVVATEEVAQALDLPVDEAREALEESPHLSSKEVGESEVWW